MMRSAADDWATAADRIITRAYTANEQLAQGSREALERAARQLASTQDNSLQLIKELQDVNRGFLAEFTGQTKDFVDQFSTEVLKTLANVRKDNEDFIRSTAETNQRTLQALVKQQMEPLLTQVQQLLGEFRAQQEAHAAAVTGLTRAVAALQGPADGLAGSARALTGSTQSIDGSLASMATAQQELAAQLQGSAQGMTTATTALDRVKDALQETLVHSTREMTGNITQASASLRDTQAGLKGTTDGLRETVDALAGTAADFRTATAKLAPATAPGPDLQQSIERLTAAIREAGPARRFRWPWRRSDGFGGR
jgi:ABC-type transporter Mla subunit MlaD